jgi:hypothetical protein
MPMTDEERGVIAQAFRDAMPTIQAMFQTYCEKVSAPQRFSIEVFDASDTGQATSEPSDRSIAVHPIRNEDWGERNFTDNGRRKARASLRTGRDTGDLVRNARELFQEGDMTSPGACLGEVSGKRICVATSGLRGTEDEPFALLTIELMKRLAPAPAS